MHPKLQTRSGWRYVPLLGILLLLLVVQPIALGFVESSMLFDVVFALLTAVLLVSQTQERGWRTGALLLGIPAAALSLAGHATPSSVQQVVLILGHCTGIVFFLLIASQIVKSIVVDRNATTDSILGAICGYLLIGVAWGLTYSMIDYLQPGSFDIGAQLREPSQHNSPHIHLFLYYSFVTLTTVGYGDISALSAPARTLAWVEALTGQLYLAVIVAGLVGRFVSHRAASGPPPTS